MIGLLSTRKKRQRLDTFAYYLHCLVCNWQLDKKFYDTLGTTLLQQTFVSARLCVHVHVCLGDEDRVFEYYGPHKNLNTRDSLHFGDTGEQIVHSEELFWTTAWPHCVVYTRNRNLERLFELN